jgi:hypothetical protein
VTYILTDDILSQSILGKAWDIEIKLKLLKLKLEDSSKPEKN